MAAFLLSDGIMTIADGLGDMVDAFREGDTIPTLNLYDVAAAESGDVAQVVLMAARIGCGLYDAGLVFKILDHGTEAQFGLQLNERRGRHWGAC